MSLLSPGYKKLNVLAIYSVPQDKKAQIQESLLRKN